MFELDLNRVRANVAKATTDDLLERATVYRDGMEPAALDLIETELRRRGVSYAEQAAFAEAHEKAVLRGRDGLPLRCRLCGRAAVGKEWGWRKWLGIVPLFPKPFPYCERHMPPNRGKVLPPPRAAGIQ
jgi:hypothetical protein